MVSLSITLGASLVFAVVGAEPQAASNPPAAQAPAASQPAKPQTTETKTTETKAAETKPAETKPATEAAPKAAATPAPAVKKTEADLFPVEARIVENTNRQRARYGLRPLRLDFGLLRSARRHAQWMTNNRTMQHTNQPVAENIAMGQNSPEEALNSWMNSSGHRANILNASYTRIGVAAYRTPQGTTYWCQQFLH